jgi:hypothetical protein
MTSVVYVEMKCGQCQKGFLSDPTVQYPHVCDNCARQYYLREVEEPEDHIEHLRPRSTYGYAYIRPTDNFINDLINEFVNRSQTRSTRAGRFFPDFATEHVQLNDPAGRYEYLMKIVNRINFGGLPESLLNMSRFGDMSSIVARSWKSTLRNIFLLFVRNNEDWMVYVANPKGYVILSTVDNQLIIESRACFIMGVREPYPLFPWAWRLSPQSIYLTVSQRIGSIIRSDIGGMLDGLLASRDTFDAALDSDDAQAQSEEEDMLYELASINRIFTPNQMEMLHWGNVVLNDASSHCVDFYVTFAAIYGHENNERQSLFHIGMQIWSMLRSHYDLEVRY